MRSLIIAAALATAATGAAAGGDSSPPTYTTYETQTPVYISTATAPQLVHVPAVVVSNCCCGTVASLGGHLVSLPGKNDNMVVYQ